MTSDAGGSGSGSASATVPAAATGSAVAFALGTGPTAGAAAGESDVEAWPVGAGKAHDLLGEPVVACPCALRRLRATLSAGPA